MSASPPPLPLFLSFASFLAALAASAASFAFFSACLASFSARAAFLAPLASARAPASRPRTTLAAGGPALAALAAERELLSVSLGFFGGCRWKQTAIAHG
jgi:hypothetical protein